MMSRWPLATRTPDNNRPSRDGHGMEDRMSKESSSSSSSGIGFFSLLTIVFIAMKLAGIGAVAEWSWFWVLSPALAGIAAVLMVVGLAVIGTLMSRR